MYEVRKNRDYINFEKDRICKQRVAKSIRFLKNNREKFPVSEILRNFAVEECKYEE